jgi:hypothetical protein
VDIQWCLKITGAERALKVPQYAAVASIKILGRWLTAGLLALIFRDRQSPPEI